MPTKVRLVKAIVFPVVMYGCESWTRKKTGCWRIDAFELWCWNQESSESLGLQGDSTSQSYKKNQPWIFTGTTDAETEASILWPPDANNWLIGKDPDAGKDWRQEKGTTKDEMVRWQRARHEWTELRENNNNKTSKQANKQQQKSNVCACPLKHPHWAPPIHRALAQPPPLPRLLVSGGTVLPWHCSGSPFSALHCFLRCNGIWPDEAAAARSPLPPGNGRPHSRPAGSGSEEGIPRRFPVPEGVRAVAPAPVPAAACAPVGATGGRD